MLWSEEVLPKQCLDTYLLAIKSGVKFVLGSDTVMEPLMLHGMEPLMQYGPTGAKELKVMSENFGFTPMEAIVTATKNGAEACGLEDKVGTIEKGKFADLLVLEKNPAQDISLFTDKSNLKHVIKEGKLIR